MDKRHFGSGRHWRAWIRKQDPTNSATHGTRWFPGHVLHRVVNNQDVIKMSLGNIVVRSFYILKLYSGSLNPDFWWKWKIYGTTLCSHCDPLLSLLHGPHFVLLLFFSHSPNFTFCSSTTITFLLCGSLLFLELCHDCILNNGEISTVSLHQKHICFSKMFNLK